LWGFAFLLLVIVWSFGFLHGNSRLGSFEFVMDAPVLEVSLEEWGVSVGLVARRNLVTFGLWGWGCEVV
jgi:hypothetical protein